MLAFTSADAREPKETTQWLSIGLRESTRQAEMPAFTSADAREPKETTQWLSIGLRESTRQAEMLHQTFFMKGRILYVKLNPLQNLS